MSRNLAAAIDREIEGSNESLRALATSPALVHEDFALFYSQLRTSLDIRGMNALLVDLTGQHLVNTRLPWGSPLPQSDAREGWISDVVKRHEPTVSRLVMGTVAKRWVVAFSAPVMLSGTLRYVLAMSVEPTHIAKIIEDEQLEPGWVAVVTDSTGRIVARSSENDRFVGQMADFDPGCSTREGVERQTDKDGGQEVVQGYRCLKRADWRVTTVIPVSVIDAPFNELWRRYVTVGLTVFLLSLPLAYFVGRSIATPIEATAELARQLGHAKGIEPRQTRLLEASVVNQAIAQAAKDLAARTASLEESEARFRSVFDQAAVGFDQIDLEGRYISLNERLCRMLGYTREECLEKNVRLVTDPEDLPIEQMLIERLLKGDIDSYSMEKRLVTKSGEKLWVRVTSSIVKDSNGKPLYRTSAVEDVTFVRRDRLEAARLAAIVEASPDAMISLDLAGNVLTWNPGAENLLGYAAKDIVGKSVSVLKHPSRQHEFAEDLERMKRGETVKRETVKITNTGQIVDVAATLAPIKSDDGGGSLTAISMTLEDIRERRRRERHIALLNRELAHRVKNSLAVIQSLFNQSMQDFRSPEHFKQAFHGRLQALAASTDLLTQADWGSVNLREFAMRVLAPVQISLEEKLRTNGPEVCLPPDIATPIGLALYELGTNAIKYGAWSVATGHVDLAWHTYVDEGKQRLMIRWSETGGPPVSEPSRIGFGSVLITRGVPRARVARRFAATGFECEIDIAIAEHSPAA